MPLKNLGVAEELRECRFQRRGIQHLLRLPEISAELASDLVTQLKKVNDRIAWLWPMAKAMNIRTSHGERL